MPWPTTCPWMQIYAIVLLAIGAAVLVAVLFIWLAHRYGPPPLERMGPDPLDRDTKQ